MMGKLIWLMGPSGSGKDSLLADPVRKQRSYWWRIASRATPAPEVKTHSRPERQEFLIRAGQICWP